jgi:hypothetical protein
MRLARCTLQLRELVELRDRPAAQLACDNGFRGGLQPSFANTAPFEGLLRQRHK